MAHSDDDMLRSIHNMWAETQEPEPRNRQERRAQKARKRQQTKRKLRQADLTRED